MWGRLGVYDGVDIGRGQEGHSCVGDSGNAWVLWKVLGSQVGVI